MSCTEIYGIEKKDTICIGEVRNAFRGAMAVWMAMEKKYLPKYIPDWAKQLGRTNEEYSRTTPSFGSDKNPMKEIWELANNNNVPRAEKIVLGSTFDKVLVKVENIKELISAFREFEAETSLKEQADLIEKAIEENSDIVAVGWNQTSVNGDTWDNINFNEETEEHEGYDIETGSDHWFLIEEINTDEEKAGTSCSQEQAEKRS